MTSRLGSATSSAKGAASGAIFPLQAINGWRGPGALAIAIAHFAVITDIAGVERLQCIAVLVDLFFVLSGVLIAQNYTTVLARRSAMPEYVVRRFGRIWPVHAAMLAILVAIECGKLALVLLSNRHFPSPPFSAQGINLPEAIPTNLLLIQSLGLHDRETWNFPSWSLSVEFVVYVVFALVCLIAPVPRRILTAAVIVLSLAVLIAVAPNGMRSTWDYGIFRCLAGFFAGTLVYDVAARWPLPRWPLPTLVEILALAALFAWMALSAETWTVYAAPVVFALLVLVFIGERGAVSRLFRSPLFQKGADLSFAIYMVHAIVLVIFLSLLHEYGRWTHQDLFTMGVRPWRGEVQLLHVAGVPLEMLLFGLYVASVILMALAAYTYIEVPGRAMFNRVAKRLKARTSVPTSLSRRVAPSDASEGHGF